MLPRRCAAVTQVKDNKAVIHTEQEGQRTDTAAAQDVGWCYRGGTARRKCVTQRRGFKGMTAEAKRGAEIDSLRYAR